MGKKVFEAKTKLKNDNPEQEIERAACY